MRRHRPGKNAPASFANWINQVSCLSAIQISSTLSGYMITIFQVRHSGMDSRQAILPGSLWVNVNLFQTDLCRKPGTHDKSILLIISKLVITA
jgi:hypothetical protein